MNTETNSATVYLIDDELAIRDSMTYLIESAGLKTKSYESAEAFLNDHEQIMPGCLLLDVRMPSMSGLELQEKLAQRNIYIPIIFISGNADIPETASAFRAGALDFFEKPFDHDTLLQRIYEAIDKDAEFRNRNSEMEKIKSCFDRLTQREKEVLKLIIDNNSSKQVAKQLAISPRTIDAHRARIMEKMQANNVVGLVAKVMSYPYLYES